MFETFTSNEIMYLEMFASFQLRNQKWACFQDKWSKAVKAIPVFI